MKSNIKSYNLTDLKEALEDLGEKSYRAEQIFKWIFVENVTSFDEMTNLSKELREKLKEKFDFHNFNIIQKQVSKDGTKKYLFDTLDGNAIESVLMEYKYGKTICVSSQIGCKMGCKFCASTGIKFARNLEAGEIVEQLLNIQRDENIKISNLVFMGIGEPLDNFDNVMKAIEILNNQKGINMGARHISISTSGLVPKIYELADKNIQCTLSISLHSANNEKRSQMMPVNNIYNIEELIKACKYYIDKTNRRISFEYALAKDNNDNLKAADELAKLLKGMLCHVNLIPINKIENGKFSKSSNENIIKFRDYLNKKGIVATIRRELRFRYRCSLWPTKEKRGGKMRIFAKTDIGKERQMNQDFYYASTDKNGKFELCILADGMGGYKGGEVASSLATTSAKRYIEENFDRIEHNKEELQALVKRAMDYSNFIVYEESKKNKELEQMGTTLEICLIYENRAYIGHIGDSRIYRIRKGIMRRITTDHSYVEELVKDRNNN